jgi:hypothetical protein
VNALTGKRLTESLFPVGIPIELDFVFCAVSGHEAIRKVVPNAIDELLLLAFSHIHLFRVFTATSRASVVKMRRNFT